VKRCIILFFSLHSLAVAQAEFDAGYATFPIGVNNEIYPYRVFSTFVLPRERIVLRFPSGRGQTFAVSADAGVLERTDDRRFVWRAPERSGPVNILATNEFGEALQLNVIVLVPSSRIRNGRLNGYEVGAYPPPLGNDVAYAAPRGYIEVREDSLNLQVSPHFVLGQFVSDTAANYPKYIVLRERLLLKLEALLERVNNQFQVDSFGILSGYRTPVHNERVRGATYSRHIYGGAAAVVIDQDPADGRFDDINGDGRISFADAQYLFTIADELFGEPQYWYLRGGLAVYPANVAYGPYLHIDARGVRARWRGDTDIQEPREATRARHRRDFP
jgi:hypothetical protein